MQINNSILTILEWDVFDSAKDLLSLFLIELIGEGTHANLILAVLLSETNSMVETYHQLPFEIE